MGNDKTAEFTISVKGKPVVRVTDTTGEMTMEEGYGILMRWLFGLPLIDEEEGEVEP